MLWVSVQLYSSCTWFTWGLPLGLSLVKSGIFISSVSSSTSWFLDRESFHFVAPLLDSLHWGICNQCLSLSMVGAVSLEMAQLDNSQHVRLDHLPGGVHLLHKGASIPCPWEEYQCCQCFNPDNCLEMIYLFCLFYCRWVYQFPLQ